MIKIAPSLLSADFTRLYDEVKKAETGGADLIHIDVMDGHFVPNITIGIPVVAALRKITKLPLDVHLMIDHPDQFIDAFVDAGADLISVHVEAAAHVRRTVQKMKERNIKASIALNPGTSLASVEYILPDVDMVLLMTVNPGFGGQFYMESVTEKIHALSQIRKAKNLLMDIEVDGGISPDNIARVAKAGANVFVSGSTIFGAKDIPAMIGELRQMAQENYGT